MILTFSKMHGAGNDFVMADDSAKVWPRDIHFIRALCERRLGIGADGIILLAKTPEGIRMDYYNADGSEAALCGNGLRCAAIFAKDNGLTDANKMQMLTASGKLSAEIVGPQLVRIGMPITEEFRKYEVDSFTTIYKGGVGVPHGVISVPSITRVDVRQQGRRYRFHPAFQPDGANINFIELPEDFSQPVKIRTYERGVEDETLACGTGVTAAAICARLFFNAPATIDFLCEGGDVLRIELTCKDNIVQDAHLTGPARVAFSGTLESGDFCEERVKRNI